MPKGRALKWFTTLRKHQAIADDGQAAHQLLGDMSVADHDGATVTRILQEIWAVNDVANNPKILTWGITFVNEDARIAGAYPDTDDEDERIDWLGRGQLYVVTPVINENIAYAKYDLRAQRLVRHEYNKLMTIYDVDTNGTGGVFYTSFTRVLVRMP